MVYPIKSFQDLVAYFLCIGAELSSRGTNINRLGDPPSISNLDISILEILLYDEEPEAQRDRVVCQILI